MPNLTGETFSKGILKLVVKDIPSEKPIKSVTITSKRSDVGKIPAAQYFLQCTNLTALKNILPFHLPDIKLKRSISFFPLHGALKLNGACCKNHGRRTLFSSTRNNQRIEISPLEVEVLVREEMDEENTIKPINIARILGDVSDLRFSNPVQ